MMCSALSSLCYSLKGRAFQMLWISIILYCFMDTFIYYQTAPQFYHLRNILGSGLYISRGTAAVLNISCALVLLPLCKKLNKVLYRALSRLWPGLFFFWLERAKSFHMTVAATLVLFAVIHSISHFANLWNFSRHYNEKIEAVNLANFKNENPVYLLLTQPGVTGVTMLLITTLMGMTSLRTVRRKCYNAFWYTHHLYLPFMVLLLIHPLGGALKEEVLDTGDAGLAGQMRYNNLTAVEPKFVAIQSKTWLWMAFPLSCFFVDLLWRLLSRNLARVDILELGNEIKKANADMWSFVCVSIARPQHFVKVTYMPGRTISLKLSCPNTDFHCRIGQYVLLQCLDVSLIEWHPFTLVKLPSICERNFMVWIRVTGDWTETLERLLLERQPKTLAMLVDGPFSSPMEGVNRSNISVCIAAGVGITPFVATLQSMLLYPRSRLPGRIHLIWIVRHECEISWLADLANKTLLELRNSNRPDRLHLELYVTNTSENIKSKTGVDEVISHVVVLNDNGGLTHSIITKTGNKVSDDERITLLTPKATRNTSAIRCNGSDKTIYLDNNFKVAEKYPVLGCRLRKGRPYWNRLFEYWAHMYPHEHLSLYCCGPKKLVKLLRDKSKYTSQTTSTTMTFVHEGFS